MDNKEEKNFNDSIKNHHKFDDNIQDLKASESNQERASASKENIFRSKFTNFLSNKGEENLVFCKKLNFIRNLYDFDNLRNELFNKTFMLGNKELREIKYIIKAFYDKFFDIERAFFILFIIDVLKKNSSADFEIVLKNYLFSKNGLNYKNNIVYKVLLSFYNYIYEDTPNNLIIKGLEQFINIFTDFKNMIVKNRYEALDEEFIIYFIDQFILNPKELTIIKLIFKDLNWKNFRNLIKNYFLMKNDVKIKLIKLIDEEIYHSLNN